MRQTDFNQILLESVNEAIAAALGKPITPELNQHLQAFIGMSSDEIPNHVDRLFSSLRDSFGTSGDSLCKMIVKRMYARAGVSFYEISGQPMIQYVKELEAKLGT